MLDWIFKCDAFCGLVLSACLWFGQANARIVLAQETESTHVIAAEEGPIELDTLRRELIESKERAGAAAVPSADMEAFGDDLESEAERLKKAEMELLSQMDEGRASLKPSESEVQSPPLLKEAEIQVVKSKPARQAAPVEKTALSSDAGQSESRAGALKSELDSNANSLEELKETHSRLKLELAKSKRRENELKLELEETRDRLIIAETEVERLSGLLEQRNRSTLAKYSPVNGKHSASSAKKSDVSDSTPELKLVSQNQQEKMAADMPVATVMVNKAHLRSGPGKDNSPLMSVSRGTRLVVETRHGEWYRVIAPSGTRAWVASEVLAFGPTSSASPTRTIRIKGYDSSLEDEAVRHIRTLGDKGN